MATGKSTVGQAIGEATGWPVVDNDALLERTTGCTAVRMLERDGLEALRSAESDVLTLVLSLPGPLVSGVAAGVVLAEPDRVRLRAGGHVVYLRTPVPMLVRRLSPLDHRPFLQGDPVGALTAMSAARDPLYLEVAHQVIDMAVLTPRQAARDVLAVLDGLRD